MGRTYLRSQGTDRNDLVKINNALDASSDYCGGIQSNTIVAVNFHQRWVFFADFSVNSESIFMKFCKHSFQLFRRLPWKFRGTGMIASSSTFRPHSGRVIRDLFRLLDAVTALYGSTSLQQSSKGSCSLLVSGYNLRADCQWRTLVPPLNSGANAAPASVLALM